MRVLKNIFSGFYIFVLWLMISFLFWGWIYTFVTDTTPARKVTIYLDVPAVEDKAMAAALEENIPPGITMIKVHSFDYVMMDMDSFNAGDIFIIPVSEDEEFVTDLIPLDGQQKTLVYDADTGEGCAMQYIQYGDEDYLMYLGSGSVHLDDGIALAVAREILGLK